VTYDNRPHLDYIKIHNKNITEYAKKWGYEYKFIDSCEYNNYWCKIHIVLDCLNNKTNIDYVIWLDSDTIINNFDICFGDVLMSYDKDIFIGHDNNNTLHLTNAGVFAIRNTNIGKQFLIDCIDGFYTDCLKQNGDLYGMWAGTCYEQGIMNLIIAKKYKKNTVVLSDKMIYNNNICRKDVFIMHMCGASPAARIVCFSNTK
jgi:hypothetical protein